MTSLPPPLWRYRLLVVVSGDNRFNSKTSRQSGSGSIREGGNNIVVLAVLVIMASAFYDDSSTRVIRNVSSTR